MTGTLYTPTGFMVMIAARYPLAAEEPRTLRAVAEEIFSESESPSKFGTSGLVEKARIKFESRGLERLLSPSNHSVEGRTWIEGELQNRFPFFSDSARLVDLQAAAFHVFEAWDKDKRPTEGDHPFRVPESYMEAGMKSYLEEMGRFGS